MNQEYMCLTCRVESRVPYEEGEGVYAVSQRLNADHRKWSPECKGEPHVLMPKRETQVAGEKE